MTLDSVFQTWASSITDGAIPAARNAAKLPTMRGYIMASIDNTVTTTAAYPFKATIVSADGMSFTVDVSKDDAAPAGGDETSLTHWPVNNTLLKHMLSSSWVIGASADFAATQSGTTVW